VRHSIRVIVQVGDDFGSVRINLDGDDDAFDDIDMSDLAEIAGKGLAEFLTGEPQDDEDEDDVLLALPGIFDDDAEDKPN
jgi:hypothetical protein